MAIQVPADSVGKIVRTKTDSGTQEQQTITLGDGSSATNVVAISASAPAGTEVGLIVRNIPSGTQQVQSNSANLATQTTLASVDGKITACNTGAVVISSGSVTATVQQSNITADYDTGAGTQTTTMFGIALPASGGAVAGGTATNPIQVSLANTAANATAVKVDGSAVTQPVSGSVTVTQATGTNLHVVVDSAPSTAVTNAGTFATQSTLAAETTKVIGTINVAASQTIAVTQATAANLKVDLSGTGANTTALKVDGSAVTQPVSLTTTTITAIGDGTTTPVKVQNLTNAKSLSVAIMDGSGTQITSFGGGTQYADGATQATPTGTAALGKNASNILHALSLDGSGNLNVNLAAGTISGGNAAASATGAAVPASADYAGFNSGGNLVGVSSANPFPVTLANTGANTNKLLVTPDSVALPANQSVNVSQINGVATTMGNGIAGTGVQRVVIASDNTAFSVNATLSAETTKVIGTVNLAASQTIAVTNTGTFAVQSTPVVPTTGGCSTFHLVAAGTTNVTNVKASAGQVYGWTVFNNANYPVYVKLHNTAGTPTVGVGVVRTIGCQAGTYVSYANPSGLAFGTGIGISIVKDITDAGTTVVVASDCVLDLEWK